MMFQFLPASLPGDPDLTGVGQHKGVWASVNLNENFVL
jgi:hypothetical protein